VTLAAGALDPRGPVAEGIADLWWLMLAVGTVIFLVFAALLALALFRQRDDAHARDEDAGEDAGEDAARDEEGIVRRWIVGGGVVMPAVVLVLIFGATLYAMRVLPSGAPADALEVQIVGHQWWYEVTYPDEGVTLENELHIPVGRPIALRLTSADVIHSFWVPALAGKTDMLPDGVNTLVLQADVPGEHVARCAEFCGLHHATMELLVVAESEDDFAAWMAAQR
jgi:cytochrome c oxidase subunit 2